jgi:hypothetical protein
MAAEKKGQDRKQKKWSAAQRSAASRAPNSFLERIFLLGDLDLCTSSIMPIRRPYSFDQTPY